MYTFGMVSLQDLLMHLALEEGCLKAGQRYWACFALRQVVSRLSAESMHELLASRSNGRNHRIEDGAVLLVSFMQVKSMRIMARHTCPLFRFSRAWSSAVRDIKPSAAAPAW